MAEAHDTDGSQAGKDGNRWLGLTPYQQILVLPPILYLAGTLTIPGVRSEISVAAGALVLALVLLGLFWSGAAGRRKRGAGCDGDASADSDSDSDSG